MRFIPLLMCCITALIVRSSAAPSPLATRDTYAPPILQPSADTEWTKGSVQTVVWDVTSAPENLLTKGALYLVNDEGKSPGPDYVLANGFDIIDGVHEIKVPDVPSGLYQVHLIGDDAVAGDDAILSATFSIVDTGTETSKIETQAYVPPLLEPSANISWIKGSVQTVVWDITNPPKHESTWKLYVRNPASSALDHLLAEDFDIMDGSLDVTVPDIRSGPYEVVLIGNGETTSPTFSIVGANPEAEKWVPTLLEPNADAQWIKGSVYTVVWDVTSPPEGDFNTRGALYLKDAASTTMEHLLGTNFDIMDGSRDVIVPDDIPAGSYQVVLVGNAVTDSPTFSIVDAEA